MAVMLAPLSITCSTSGGTDTFSTTRLVISIPYFSASAGLMSGRSASPHSVNCVATFGTRTRNVAVGQCAGEDTHDARPHRARKIVQTEVIVGPGHLAQKTQGIAHAKIVR